MPAQERQHMSHLSFNRICQEIERELEKAFRKFPSFPVDPIHAQSVMGEEAGETLQAALQAVYEGGSLEKVRGEAIQTAAMCLRLIHGIDSGLVRLEGDGTEDQLGDKNES